MAKKTLRMANETIIMAKKTLCMASETIIMAKKTLCMANETIIMAKKTFRMANETIIMAKKTFRRASETIIILNFQFSISFVVLKARLLPCHVGRRPAFSDDAARTLRRTGARGLAPLLVIR
jgi:hypothetical protein